jgi:biotin operon repressor
MAQLQQALPLVERQHTLIEELRARMPGYVTGAVLAARTGTTIRTVERDIARLTAAGYQYTSSPLHVRDCPQRTRQTAVSTGRLSRRPDPRVRGSQRRRCLNVDGRL